MLYRIEARYVPLTYLGDYGCFVALENGVLYHCPATNTLPPEPDIAGYTPVECVDTEGVEEGTIFLNQVNQLYGTDFKVKDFDNYRMAYITL